MGIVWKKIGKDNPEQGKEYLVMDEYEIVNGYFDEEGFWRRRSNELLIKSPEYFAEFTYPSREEKS